MTKKTIGMGGFTLAEVLITLGIIGVVAAMTMPTLINSTNGAQYKTAYKKALSVMSQAVVMNIALDDYDLSQTVKGTNGDESVHSAETQTIYTLFRNRMNVVKVTDDDGMANYSIVDLGDESDIPTTSHFGNTSSSTTETKTGGDDSGNVGMAFIATAPTSAIMAADEGGVGKWTYVTKTPQDWTYMFFNDGIMFMFDNTQGDCHAATKVQNDAYCSGWIDVNGEKGPNKVVRCDTSTKPTTYGDDATCTVSNPTDIYPIMFYDQTIVPASAAARAVLYSK